MSDTVASVADARPVSVWLDRPGERPTERVPEQGVVGRISTDLLVIGGGLTGLWAAVEAAGSGREVTVVEAGRLGGGASGKCGGFINASITHGIAHGHARWPAEMPAIVGLQQAVWDETLDLLAAHGAAHVVESCGKFTVATRPHQLSELDASLEVLHSYGQTAQRLSGEDMRRSVNSSSYLGGLLHENSNGLCDPVALLDALVGIASGRGARLVEHLRVTGLSDEGSSVAARFDGGSISARQVLLATNAAAPLRKRLRHQVIPVYDHVIATAPLTESQWSAIGWASRRGITDAGNQFHYYRPTPDGRVLFGGWDATYHFGGRVDEQLEYRRATHRVLAEHLVQTFPALEGTEVTHAWGGPIDSTSRFTPTFGTAMGGKLGWSIGFTGLGVGASRFGAQVALDLLARHDTERTQLSMVRRSPIPFPPEPLRYPVIQFTKWSLAREDRTGRRNLWLRLLNRFGVGFDT